MRVTHTLDCCGKMALSTAAVADTIIDAGGRESRRAASEASVRRSPSAGGGARLVRAVRAVAEVVIHREERQLHPRVSRAQ